MRKSILSLSIFLVAGLAAAASYAVVGAQACYRSVSTMCAYALEAVAPSRILLQLHAPSTWVAPARAFVGRLMNRFRPMKTPGWSLCPSA